MASVAPNQLIILPAAECHCALAEECTIYIQSLAVIQGHAYIHTYIHIRLMKR